MDTATAPSQSSDQFELLGQLLPGATRKLMFGHPTYVWRGHMFIGFCRGRLYLRLSSADRSRFVADYGPPKPPIPGWPTSEYVEIPPTLVGSRLNELVRRSFWYAQSLPPKRSRWAVLRSRPAS